MAQSRVTRINTKTRTYHLLFSFGMNTKDPTSVLMFLSLKFSYLVWIAVEIYMH